MRPTLAEVESNLWNRQTEEGTHNSCHIPQIPERRPLSPRTPMLHGLAGIHDKIVNPCGIMMLFDSNPIPEIIQSSTSAYGANNTRNGQ